MVILKEAVAQPLSLDDVRARVRAVGLTSPDESTGIIRRARDAE